MVVKGTETAFLSLAPAGSEREVMDPGSMARQGRQQAAVDRASAESQRKQATALPEYAALAERSRLLRQHSLTMLEALAAHEEEVARGQ
jgi:hypothetical protein